MLPLKYPITDGWSGLKAFAQLFTPDKKYTEKEVNKIITRALDDYVTRGTKMMIERFPIIEEEKVFLKLASLFSADDKHSEKDVYAIIKVVLNDYYVLMGSTKKVETHYDGEIVLHKIAGILSNDNKYSDKEIHATIKGVLDDYVRYFSIEERYSNYLWNLTDDEVLRSITLLFTREAGELLTNNIKTEKEINAIIKRACADHVTIRSNLIDFGILDRTSNCNEYWVQNENHYQAEEHRHFGILNIFDDTIGCIGDCYPPWVNIIDPYKLPLK